jgi:hypothetical protein
MMRFNVSALVRVLVSAGMLAIPGLGSGHEAMAQRAVVGHRHDHGAEAALAHDHAGNDHAATHDQDHDLLHPASDADAACACDAVRLSSGWCRRCNSGSVAGVQVGSALLYSTLDPHGHVLDLGSITCPECAVAIGSDGFCEACSMGYVRGVVYFTRLTHGFAAGRVIEPDRLGCEDCRRHSAEPGWCDRCKRGMIGSSAIYNRALFDRTTAERRVLIAANEKASTCELCACAMVVHRTCPACLVSYEPARIGQPERKSEKKETGSESKPTPGDPSH